MQIQVELKFHAVGVNSFVSGLNCPTVEFKCMTDLDQDLDPDSRA